MAAFAGKKSFTLIAHSFGANVALQLSRALESVGLSGRVLLIDGHPLLVKQMGTAAFDGKEPTIENTTDLIMQQIFSFMFPEMPSNVILDVLRKHKTVEGKITAFDTPTQKRFSRTNEQMLELIGGIRNRIKMALDAPDNFGERIGSPITLVRPAAGSSADLDEKNQLACYTKGQVDIKFVEGTHFTMLENDELLKFINDVYLAN